MLKLKSIRRRTVRRAPTGLTLLELVVVMAILVVIAGVLVPLLPNLLSNANNAVGAVNVTELDKAFQTYQAVNYQFPDQYDSLLGSDGTLASQVLMSGWTGATADLPVATLTASQATSLNNAGINNLCTMAVVPTASATFPGVLTTTTGSGMSAVTTPTLTPVASGASVLTATPAYVQSVFGPNSVSSADLGSSPANIYVVMGVGAYCTIVGDPNVGIAEAPVRGSPSDNSDPSKTYGRFAVVYKVSNTGGTASLVGCACPGGMGLMSSDGMEQKYYSTVHQ